MAGVMEEKDRSNLYQSKELAFIPHTAAGSHYTVDVVIFTTCIWSV